MTEAGAGAPRILVADDDPAVRSALERVLRFNGYEVELAADGLETLEAIDRAAPDAVVLDWMMPNLDGIGTCRMLRGRGDDLPVLLLTARDELDDRIAGLDAGADDYIAKPFELEELTARLRALLRRSRGFGAEPGGDEVLRFADLVLNVDTREVRRGGRPLHLTRTEFDLLELLMRRPRRVLERARIHEEVWGFDFGRSSNSLHVYIGYLRRKTEEHGGPRLIHTVRGVGYALREGPV
ncbi:response regulator transcription factor [Actinomadura montaniterrae]|uniref:Response regulator transcription factor n=1 Tax=Actinomadura montaniterrae TaxID=1803903 RepID=A0A6L3W4K4_9ACTN|nr:response regulator transcription factor [Actinomadura montaniterrae]KAB2387919.1 response regulator transcription factor [Actinomadura montaniterrae]